MNQTIALIDDDRNILTSISIALEKEGFKVLTYLDGESALIGLMRSPPDLAIIDKRRAVANQSEVMNIIGDIDGKVCIVPDDLIDTAGTLCNAADALKEKGAKAVKAYITHPVLSGPAIERLNNSSLDELVVTNSIPLNKEAQKCSKIRVISLASTIAECIKRLSNEESLSEMFL